MQKYLHSRAGGSPGKVFGSFDCPHPTFPRERGKGIPACAGMTSNKCTMGVCIGYLFSAYADRLDNLAPFDDFAGYVFTELSGRIAERLSTQSCETL